MFRIFLKYGCAVGDSLKILLLPDNITTIEVYIRWWICAWLGVYGKLYKITALWR